MLHVGTVLTTDNTEPCPFSRETKSKLGVLAFLCWLKQRWILSPQRLRPHTDDASPVWSASLTTSIFTRMWCLRVQRGVSEFKTTKDVRLNGRMEQIWAKISYYGFEVISGKFTWKKDSEKYIRFARHTYGANRESYVTYFKDPRQFLGPLHGISIGVAWSCQRVANIARGFKDTESYSWQAPCRRR